MKLWLPLIVLITVSFSAQAQETVRQVDGPGEFTKHLTPGLLDQWILQGEKGETIIAHVHSREFDPVLELARKEDPQEKVYFSIDDEGSESRFAFRLPEKGEYEIRVHAFQFKGGGNYGLQIRRFQAEPVEIDKSAIGVFDRHGKSYVYFPAEQDQVLTVQIQGTAGRAWEMLDSKGKQQSGWHGSVPIEESGEHSLVLSGGPGNRYELLLRKAMQRELAEKEHTGQLEPQEMEVWSFAGSPGDFRLLEIEATGDLAARLIYAPLEKQNSSLLDSQLPPELSFLPVAGKVGRHRFAAALGREGRYQLQLVAQSAADYTLNMADPTISMKPGETKKGKLAVGGAAFFNFQAAPGELMIATLASGSFDPLLRLTNTQGEPIDENDDGGQGMGSRIAHMVMKEGSYRLQVASLGNGGGGEFTLKLQRQTLNELKMGERETGNILPGGTDFWSFAGEEGKTVLLNVRSAQCDPSISLHSPEGVQLAGDDNGGVGTDSLLAVTLPKTGRYTVWVTSRRGGGEYSIRLLDGE